MTCSSGDAAAREPASDRPAPASISSRSPQIGTFATPGTRIRRALIFQYAVIDRSIRSSCGSADVSPIFMTRLVADSGWIINGGLAHVGSCGETWAMRSATCCRAVEQVGPGSKIISIDDSYSTDFERIVEPGHRR